MGENSDHVTVVNIYNHQYTIRSEDSQEYVRTLAQYVDEKMAEVAEATPTVDSVRVAMLAALNIADDYFTCQRRLDDLEEQLAQHGEALVTALEAALESPQS